MNRRQALIAATALAMAAPAAADAASDTDVLKLLDTFAAAWNRHDVDGLMACMTDDCVFDAAAGKEVAGTHHVGREAVRRAYAAVFETFPDGRWNNPRHFVAGDRAVSEWTFTGTPTRRRQGRGERLRRLHAAGRPDRGEELVSQAAQRLTGAALAPGTNRGTAGVAGLPARSA